MGFPMYEVLQGFTNDSHKISQREKYFWKSSVLVTFIERFLAQRVIFDFARRIKNNHA